MCMLDHKSMASPGPLWPIPMRAIGAQNLLTMPGGVTTAGYLHKKGGSQFSLLKWPLRYIIIHKGCVYYFKSSTSAAPQGAFSLNGYNRVMRAAEETTSSNVFPFKIVHFSRKHRTWLFSAASEDERRSWMRHMRKEIDHYNDRQETHTTSSDTDSDADSFYGTIERPLVISHPNDDPDNDYMEEDEDEDEEDYLKPDSPPTNTGRPVGPPPAYPPPPVPLLAPSNQLHPDSKPPPIPLPLHRIPTSPLPRKPPPVLPPAAHKPPPPTLQRNAPFAHVTPPLPPPNPRRSVFQPVQESQRVVCDQLQSSLHLSSQAQSPAHNCPRSPTHSPAPSLTPTPTPKPANSQSWRLSQRFSLSTFTSPEPKPERSPGPSLPGQPHQSKPKPPPPTCKPPMPMCRKPISASSRGRASPDGQSFRASADELPVDLRSRWDSAKASGDCSDEDDDYENVQLPDSVFIESTETSFVERCFLESGVCPDGLYAIRNSGTKKSKVLVVWDAAINKARNYRLYEEKGCIFLDAELTFPSLAILVEHYYSHFLPQHGSLRLQAPYKPCH
ncbi:unnamed protein product [Knipowitschia caucasica]